MLIKLFDNTTGLERGDVIIPPSDAEGFDVSSLDNETTTAVQSNESLFEVLVNGTLFVLDLSNPPEVPEGKYLHVSGYESKSGGGYQATWVLYDIPVSDHPTE